MSRKNRRERNAGYKPVEHEEDRETHVSNNLPLSPPQPVTPAINFRVAGKVRLSKTRQSLSIKLIEEDKKVRYMSILLQDIQDMVDDSINNTVALVREYENNVNEKKGVLHNG